MSNKQGVLVLTVKKNEALKIGDTVYLDVEGRVRCTIFAQGERVKRIPRKEMDIAIIRARALKNGETI